MISTHLAVYVMYFINWVYADYFLPVLKQNKQMD